MAIQQSYNGTNFRSWVCSSAFAIFCNSWILLTGVPTGWIGSRSLNLSSFLQYKSMMGKKCEGRVKALSVREPVITALKISSIAFCLGRLLLVLTAPAASAGPPWSGVISPERAVDWRQAGVAGGIPKRTMICATFEPGATAAQINRALSNCPGGQVVFLKSGIYNLSAAIDFDARSDFTLRGAGADQTKIVFGTAAATGCRGAWSNVCIAGADINWGGGPSNAANWTAGYARGTTRITLSNTVNLKMGSPLF